MPKPEPVHEGLLSPRALRFQRRLWAAERAAWWMQAGIVLAALAGLAGSGPLSRGSARHDGVVVDYARIARNESQGELILTLLPDAARGSTLHVDLDRRWLSGVDLERIVPEPARSRAGQDGVGFTFEVPEGRGAEIRFLLHYRAMGYRSGRLRVEGGPEVAFSQWIFP